MKKIILIILVILSSINIVIGQTQTEKSARDFNSAEEMMKALGYRAKLNFPADVNAVHARQTIAEDAANSTMLQGIVSVSNSVSKFGILTTENILNEFTNNPHNELNVATDEMLKYLISYMLGFFVGPFFLFSLVWNYYKNVVKGRVTFDWIELSGSVALLVFISSYPLIMGLFEYLMNLLPWLTLKATTTTLEINPLLQFKIIVSDPVIGLSEKEKANLIQFVSQYKKGLDMDFNKKALLLLTDRIIEVDSKMTFSGDTGISYYFSKLWESFQELPISIVVTGLTYLAIGVKFAILLIIMGFDKFLYLVGPFAITFSFIGLFKDQWKTWLTTWFMIKGCIVSFIIIDTILILSSNSSYITNIYSADYNSTSIIGLSLFSIFSYMLIPFLTSRWIGNESAGHLISMAQSQMISAISTVASKIKVGSAKSSEGGGGKEKSTFDSLSNINATKQTGGKQE